jgi:hypothetical protein
MRLRLIGGKSATLRACVAALLFCSVALSAGLSAAPQLHEWLHKVDQTSAHECAATLLSSGSWETAGGEPPTTPPSAVLLAAIFPASSVPLRARVEFSVLEHAPPALT